MNIIIDANYILRWFLNDVVNQASALDMLLREAKPESIVIDRVTIADVTYVLRSKQYDHTQIYDLFMELAYYPSVQSFGEVEAAALGLYAKTRLDFEDCLLVARVQIEKIQLGTFDKKMLSLLERS